jgi:hypothetical protein
MSTTRAEEPTHPYVLKAAHVAWLLGMELGTFYLERDRLIAEEGMPPPMGGLRPRLTPAGTPARPRYRWNRQAIEEFVAARGRPRKGENDNDTSTLERESEAAIRRLNARAGRR